MGKDFDEGSGETGAPKKDNEAPKKLTHSESFIFLHNF